MRWRPSVSRPTPRQESSHSRTSDSSGHCAWTSTAASAARRRRPASVTAAVCHELFYATFYLLTVWRYVSTISVNRDGDAPMMSDSADWIAQNALAEFLTHAPSHDDALYVAMMD